MLRLRGMSVERTQAALEALLKTQKTAMLA
jgi:hypothetical protein